MSLLPNSSACWPVWGQARFVVQPCAGLALAIEQFNAIKIGAACAEYTGAMGGFGTEPGQIDTLVLGCTHYPVARQTRRLLQAEQALCAERPPGTHRVDFYSTGDTQALQFAAQRWLGLARKVLPFGV